MERTFCTNMRRAVETCEIDEESCKSDEDTSGNRNAGQVQEQTSKDKWQGSREPTKGICFPH